LILPILTVKKNKEYREIVKIQEVGKFRLLRQKKYQIDVSLLSTALLRRNF
jgi:hypothetical protein